MWFDKWIKKFVCKHKYVEVGSLSGTRKDNGEKEKIEIIYKCIKCDKKIKVELANMVTTKKLFGYIECKDCNYKYECVFIKSKCKRYK